MPEFTHSKREPGPPRPGARLLPWPDPEVSEHPRTADLEQLQAAYVMHRVECETCTPDQSCAIARRLEEARRTAGVS
jgi:hypothetical protein